MIYKCTCGFWSKKKITSKIKNWHIIYVTWLESSLELEWQVGSMGLKTRQ
jgi:hypothetical protein